MLLPLLALLAAVVAVTVATGLSSHPIQLSYPGSAISERDLPYCKSSSVCSVLHRRFWGAPPLLERFCRCPGRLECPYLWSQDTLKDNQSMQLNNRSQLKFCKDIKSLGRCKSNQIALNVTMRHVPPDRLTQAIESVSTAATVACFCPPWPSPRNWKHFTTTSRAFMNGTTELTNSYSCAKMPKCQEGDVCGAVRQDLFSIYFKCSCLQGHICYSMAHTSPQNVSEAFFEGPAYEAHCLKYN